MKKTLLFALLFITFVGFSQTYDNTKYFISELIPSPPNSKNLINETDNSSMADYEYGVDDTVEYFEFRGTPNATIEDDVYFIVIDGDGDDSDVGSNIGKVRDAINLSGLKFGSNGILAIVANMTFASGSLDQDGTTDISGTKLTNPYATLLASSDATVVTIELTGTPAWKGTELDKFNSVSKSPDIGYDGTVNDQSSTYMIVKSTAGSPKNELVDQNEDGVLDNAATSWTIYDSVSILDDDDITAGNGEVGEFGYGKIIFVEQLASTDPLIKYDSSLSPTIITLDLYPNYVARQGNSTGYAASKDEVNNDDWVAGRTNSLSYPDWKFSSNEARNLPAELKSTNLTTSYGKVNVNFNTTASVDQIFASKVSVYPNPASNFIQISTTENITSLELYNLIGKRVLTNQTLKNNRLDTSNLSKGIYLLKFSNGTEVASKKIIIE